MRELVGIYEQVVASLQARRLACDALRARAPEPEQDRKSVV